MQLIPIQALWIPKVIPLKLLSYHSRLQTFQEGLQNIQNLSSMQNHSDQAIESAGSFKSGYDQLFHWI